MNFDKVLEDGGNRSLDYGFKRIIVGKLELARRDFEVYDDEIRKMALEVKDSVITGDTDAAYLTSVLGSARKLVNALEAERKRITGDAYDFYKAVMSFEKTYTNKINSQVISIGKAKLGEYGQKKELERRAAERRAMEATRRKQEELDRIADKEEVSRVVLDTPVVQQSANPIRADTATSSIKMEWIFEMLNVIKVPRKYCVPDHKLIMEAIRAGIRKIAGIRIYEQAKVDLRAR